MNRSGGGDSSRCRGGRRLQPLGRVESCPGVGCLELLRGRGGVGSKSGRVVCHSSSLVLRGRSAASAVQVQPQGPPVGPVHARAPPYPQPPPSPVLGGKPALSAGFPPRTRWPRAIRWGMGHAVLHRIGRVRSHEDVTGLVVEVEVEVSAELEVGGVGGGVGGAGGGRCWWRCRRSWGGGRWPHARRPLTRRPPQAPSIGTSRPGTSGSVVRTRWSQSQRRSCHRARSGACLRVRP
jgi:hypothetical protein